jgi:hypothetical protein
METGHTGIVYEFRSLSLGARYNGSQKQSNPYNEGETFLTNQVTVFYHPTEIPLAFSLSMPYVSRQAKEVGESAGLPLQRTTASGLGDVVVSMRYHQHEYIDESTLAYSFSAGVKLPTGKHDIMTDDSTYLDPDLQPGTGTTDIIFGGSGLWSWNKMGVVVNLDVGVITGQGAPEGAGQYHKYGNWLNSDMTGWYKIIPADVSEWNISGMFGIGGEYHAHEIQGGENLIPSGGWFLFITPGLKYIASTTISATAFVQIPIYQYYGFDLTNPDVSQRGWNTRLVARLMFTP